MKKNYIALTLILATSAAAFAGCADKKDNQSLPSETEQVSSESNNDNMTSQEPSSEDSENAKTEENKGIQNKNKNKGNESNAEINSNKGKINEKNSKDSKNNEKNSNINKNNNQNKNVSNTEFKKLSGKFICVDSPLLKTIPESERENARKELRNTYYDFKDDGTLIIGMNTPNGPIEFKGNFTQTKDKLVLSISIDDMNEKEESSYTFDGKTLKLTNPENLTTVFEKK